MDWDKVKKQRSAEAKAKMGLVMTITVYTRTQEKARENPCGPSAPCFLSI